MDKSTKLDTAEQLTEIAHKLSLLMEILPFKKLEYYLRSFRRNINGQDFIFDFGPTVAPLYTCPSDMVIMVPVMERTLQKPGGAFDFLVMVNLVFTKCTPDIGYWNIHQAKFNTQDYSTIMNQPRSSQSEIIDCGSLSLFRAGLNKFSMPANLVEKVCSSLQKIINDSIKKREAILKQLNGLNVTLEQIKG